MTNLLVIENLFSEYEIQLIKEESNKCSWELKHVAGKGITKTTRVFWVKDIINTKLTELFKKKIEAGIKQNIEIRRLKINGQSHGQCAEWHTDIDPNSVNFFSMVYFPNDWLPEYGGHLMIKDNNNKITSILPEFNKGVIFNSTASHIGLEPTIHCITQRESIACIFRVLR